MSVLLKYTASSGREYNLKTKGMIRTKTANYHKWEWGVDGTALQFGYRVANFTRQAATYTTRLIFDGPLTERKALVENLHQDFELDVRNMSPGRITWGDYWIDCYITASSTFPDENDIYTDNDLTIYCPHPFWTRELTKSFIVHEEDPQSADFLEYEFDYKYDYFYGETGTERWITNNPFPSDFRMTIFGPVADPRVVVNGYPYQINDTLEAGEYVVIDSRKNTITKYLVSGRTQNIFDLRDKTQSIFQPIPAGTLTINWSGLFGFDLTIYIERSEPRWS